MILKSLTIQLLGQTARAQNRSYPPVLRDKAPATRGNRAAPLFRRPLQIRKAIGIEDFQFIQTQCSGVLPQHIGSFAIIIRQHHPLRVTGRGLKSQRAASGKQIQRIQTGQILTQPIEKFFADTVRRWTQTVRICKNQFPSPALPADDTDLI